GDPDLVGGRLADRETARAVVGEHQVAEHQVGGDVGRSQPVFQRFQGRAETSWPPHGRLLAPAAAAEKLRKDTENGHQKPPDRKTDEPEIQGPRPPRLGGPPGSRTRRSIPRRGRRPRSLFRSLTVCEPARTPDARARAALLD